MSSTKKILLISDHPLFPSGVGTQAKYLIEGLLATGKYEFFCIGGAVKHPNYNLMQVAPEKYGDKWKILPVDGFGTKNDIRRLLLEEKPDAVLLFTDPRFFVHVWEMEDEIRRVCPLLYWHVWDNDPIPTFNRAYYDSTDYIAALSLKTYGLLQGMDYPKEKFSYIPHALPDDIFKPIPEEECKSFKKNYFGPHGEKEFILFWNNRNARRKLTGDVVATFAKFAKKVGSDKVSLMMHTDPRDMEGQDIFSLAKCFGVEKNLIISEQRIQSEELNRFYNVCDVTINISNAEGFGLGTLESLFSGNPIIVQMTGGLQFQIGDWWQNLKDFSNQEKMYQAARNSLKNGKWWGIPVFPASRSCTGNQQIPFIYEDRASHEDVVDALVEMFSMGREKRREMGMAGREWALKNFSMEKTISDWDRVLEEQMLKHKQNNNLSYRSCSI